MQFLAALIVGIIALLMAAFFLPRVQDTLNLRVSTTTQQAAVSQGAAPSSGLVKGVSISHDALEPVRLLGGASTFISLFTQTNTASLFSATGTYTIFVPTNDAFARASLPPFATMTAEERARLAAYHVLPEKKLAIGDVKAGDVIMLSRDELNTGIFDSSEFVDSNTKVVATYRSGNGIVYVIDHVLLPPERRPFPF